MAKYRGEVFGKMTAWATVEVEAEDLAAARINILDSAKNKPQAWDAEESTIDDIDIETVQEVQQCES